MTEKPKILSTVALAMSLATSGTGWPGQAPSSPSAATFPNDDKTISHVLNRIAFGPRSEERRVGKECRYRWSPDHEKKKKKKKRGVHRSEKQQREELEQ